jgi:hypothetical protein
MNDSASAIPSECPVSLCIAEDFEGGPTNGRTVYGCRNWYSKSPALLMDWLYSRE